MDVACPSLPLNVLAPDKPRPTFRHTPRMAPDGCHLVACSLYVLLVIIEISSSPCAIMTSRELSCIRQDHRSCQPFSANQLPNPPPPPFANSEAASVPPPLVLI